MIRKNKGFTLIELLVVIAIIGILSSVVLASLNSARTKSRDAKRVSDIKQLQLALELYFDDNGSYPAVTDLDSSTLVADGFISAIPHDPVGTAVDYNYAYYPATPTNYHMGATLENTTHVALDSDVDCTSTVAGCFVAEAAGGGFDGAVEGVYDVKP
jgi:type II secretion system protein G